MIVKWLHDKGLTSEHCYAAGFASIGLALVSWTTSLQAENAGVSRADRWGIFIGEWAPTFFALGLAVRTYEEPEQGDDAGVERRDAFA
ncbi:hypothetical protein V2S66_31235 [Streptomyces sp. V4-01]|uniref:Uncharacterized protein n=1 Tax=Actinacidiphila polyblastidii TaxID=3110430 RepID=A0ABU7PKQ3_9ACTN|nr:hypothetical protein [Streptomyces sp. V4-01]